MSPGFGNRARSLYEPNFVALLGSHRDEVSDEIRRVLSTMQDQELKASPKLALQNLVAIGTLDDIGGILQTATAAPVGLELKSYVRLGQPQAARYFLGLDLDRDIGPVRHDLISTIGTI